MKDSMTYVDLEEYIQRFKDYMDGNLSPEELACFREWVAKEPARQRLLKRIEAKHLIAAKLRFAENGWKEEDWEKVKRRLYRSRRVKRLYQYAAAASVILLLGLGSVWILNREKARKFPVIVQTDNAPAQEQSIRLELASGKQFNLNDTVPIDINEEGTLLKTTEGGSLSVKTEATSEHPDTNIKYNRLVVPRTKNYHLVLADGSNIWVNSETTIEFPSDFSGTERRVRLLSGEAFFDVTPDKSKPFIVSTPEMEVNVLGTTFNVMAYAGEPQTEVTLVAGIVGVKTEHTEARLSPSEQFRLELKSGKYKIDKVDVHLYVDWKKGVLNFTALPLQELSKRISRWYDVEFKFAQEDVKRLKFTGELRREYDIEYVCRLLETISGLSFTVEDNYVVVDNI